jgi:hypothetical protein
MFRRFSSLALVLLALAAAGATTARAQGVASDPGADRRLLIRLKEAQHRAMLKEPMQGRRERLERIREAKRRAAPLSAKTRMAGERMKPLDAARTEKLHAAVTLERQRRAAAAASKSSQVALAPNHLVNNPFPDQFNAGQSEVSIAMDGLHLVAAWNDGQGYVTGGSTQGYGWSNDGGATWHDGGTIPLGGGVTNWASDPVVTVNEKTHKFYFASLVDIGASNNGVGVVEGTFIGVADTLKWGTPMQAVARPNATVLCDKEWIVADSTNNTLHIVYSRFVISGGSLVTDHIDYVRGTFSGSTWSFAAAVQLSSGSDAGFVQGSRIGTGPAGEVYATWIAIGQPSNSYYGRDYLRMRKSTIPGVFGAQVTPDSVFSNFGAGAPGFNRATGITFPGMTVDRSTGPNRGRVYLTWNESINFYSDNLGYLVHRAESEGNNTSGAADVFTVGDSLTGQIVASDVDWWKFTGTRGQTVTLYTNQMASSLDLQTEILCTDGNTVMSYSENGAGGFTLHVFTLPADGTYYLRAQAWDGISTGTYSIVTGLHVPFGGGAADRARDQRDIFVKYSADGSSWPVTPRLASTEPPYFDDYLPEVAVAGNGKPYVAWFDFHDAPAGVCLGCGSNAYLARSDDAGLTWVAGSPVSDTTTVWSNVNSNIEPNMGDYIGLFSTPTAVVIGWADGRLGDPNVYMASVPINYTGTTVSLVGTQATPASVTVTWQASDTNGLVAHVERLAPGGSWTDLGQILSSGNQRYVYTDNNVTKGETYGYRLSVSIDGDTPQILGQTSVYVPTGLSLALEGARPNPAPGTVNVFFTLPDNRPAHIELLDITGRKVAGMDVGGSAGPQNVDVTQGRRMRAGMYVIRLTHADQTLTRRVAVVE